MGPVSRRVLLITGSRFWTDVWTIKHTLDRAVTAAGDDGVTELVLRHGACYPPVDKDTGRRPFRSADYLAHLWCQKHARMIQLTPVGVLTEQARPADWTAACRPACSQRTHRNRNVGHRRLAGGRLICPDAGKYRNRDMVLEEPRPYLGIAFHLDNSAGTAHCIRTMREFSIPVATIAPGETLA